MSTRISSAALALLLVACGQDAAEAPAPDPDDLIECALDGLAAFERACVIEVAQVDGLSIVVIRHPDGGFRRLEWVSTRGGPELQEADGAERAQVEERDGVIHVTIGDDRYRIPASGSQDADAR